MTPRMRCIDSWHLLGMEHGHEVIGRGGTAVLATWPAAACGQVAGSYKYKWGLAAELPAGHRYRTLPPKAP